MKQLPLRLLLQIEEKRRYPGQDYQYTQWTRNNRLHGYGITMSYLYFENQKLESWNVKPVLMVHRFTEIRFQFVEFLIEQLGRPGLDIQPQQFHHKTCNLFQWSTNSSKVFFDPSFPIFDKNYCIYLTD